MNNLAALHQWPSKGPCKAVKGFSLVLFFKILDLEFRTVRVLQGAEVRLQEVFLISAAIFN